MRYVSLDCETTGLNPDTCQILEFAAVLSDTEDLTTPVLELPFFRRVLKHRAIKGEPYGLYMNAQLLRQIAEDRIEAEHMCWPGQLIPEFAKWLSEHKIDTHRVNVAGKNFASFDRQFLERLESGRSTTPVVKFRHRVLDPAMLYLRPDDEAVPATDECLRRAGIAKTTNHTALADARLVIELLRAWTGSAIMG